MAKIQIESNFDPNADLILYEGDCLKLLSEIPDNFCKLVVTSPPYNLGKDYEEKLELGEYIKQQQKVIEECVRILDDQGSICWQVGNFVDNGEILPLDIVLHPLFDSLGLHLRNRIIWHFGHGLHASKRFSGRYEVILWYTKNEDYTFNLDPVRIPQKYPKKRHFKGPNKGKLSCNPNGKNPSDIWEIPNVKANHVEKTIHPCQFPIELIERLVLSMTNEGEWVFDPFMGVGSTALAALINNRKAIGAEIMPDYIKIIKNRIHLAEKGQLRVRPLERSVYDPKNPRNIPPKMVEINPVKSKQSKLTN
ncbi:site-specific DNA-methyltransferase [Methanobacterium sp. YSL]|nr:site-specific DNA-methyltransferase [Methanobacterium sp. YSL]